MESAKSLGSPGIKNSLVAKLKEELLKKLDVLSPYLPHNTLDELIMGLGGPHVVAEVRTEVHMPTCMYIRTYIYVRMSCCTAYVRTYVQYILNVHTVCVYVYTLSIYVLRVNTR